MTQTPGRSNKETFIKRGSTESDLGWPSGQNEQRLLKMIRVKGREYTRCLNKWAVSAKIKSIYIYIHAKRKCYKWTTMSGGGNKTARKTIIVLKHNTPLYAYFLLDIARILPYIYIKNNTSLIPSNIQSTFT